MHTLVSDAKLSNLLLLLSSLETSRAPSHDGCCCSSSGQDIRGHPAAKFVLDRPTIASGIDDRPISGEKDFDFFPAFTVQLQLFTFYSFNGRGARRAIKSRLCSSPLNFCRMKSTRRLLCHATRQRQQQSAIARRLRAFVRL